MGQFLLKNILSTLSFIIITILVLIQQSNSKQISSEIYKSGARLKYDVGDNLDIQDIAAVMQADTKESGYTIQNEPGGRPLNSQEYEDAYDDDGDGDYDGDGSSSVSLDNLYEDDYDDDCNENEIFYYKSHQCVPAKCPLGEERSHQSGFCFKKSTGQILDPTMLYSGSIYAYGRKTFAPKRTRIGLKNRRLTWQKANTYRTQRPKVYAKWFEDLHPEVKGQKPVIGV